jgi:hypothetical protein
MLATRVLLVEDDEVVGVTLAGLPEQPGFAITSAANAPDSGAARLLLSAFPEMTDEILATAHSSHRDCCDPGTRNNQHSGLVFTCRNGDYR